jgi:transposase
MNDATSQKNRRLPDKECAVVGAMHHMTDRRVDGNRNVAQAAPDRCTPRDLDWRSGALCGNGRRVRRAPRIVQAYPSDITELQWQRLRPLLTPPNAKSRSRSTDVRAVLNAINFRWRCGCTWRMLPHDFPPWETVYKYFRIWRQAGILPIIRDALLRRRPTECAR